MRIKNITVYKNISPKWIPTWLKYNLSDGKEQFQF